MDTATLPAPAHTQPSLVATPLVHTDTRYGKEGDIIWRYWKGQEAAKLRPLPNLKEAVLSNLTVGLGDTLMLTDLPRAGKEQNKRVKVASASQHFRPLMRFNPHWTEVPVEEQAIVANASSLVRHYRCGNGHYLQRIRRAFGFEVAEVPKPCVAWTGQRQRNRVVLHFEPGPHAFWQRATINPKARTLYPETRKELEAFIKSERGLEFIEVGMSQQRPAISGARRVTTRSLPDLINVMGQCAWFVGLMSGPMHLATALDLKCVVIVDFPAADTVVLPTLKQTHQVESEWCYAQNCHLHQAGDAPLVRRVTRDNLKRAFDGALYPHWDTKWCGMINDKI